MSRVVMRMVTVLFLGLFGFAAENGSGSPPVGEVAVQRNLVGRWISSDGSLRMRIVSDTKLFFNGRSFECKIDRNTIYVKDEGEMVPYPYRIDGNYLELSDPQGYVPVFVRAGSGTASPQPYPNTPGEIRQGNPRQSYPRQSYPGEGGRQRYGGAENGLLQGKYCSYSSSGGYGSSSYSSSNWAYFDGQGHFQYGSGGYYSGGGDLYGSEGADGRGTYEVRGNTIILRYSDGSSDRAYVYNRGDGGRITEVKYGDTLYAPQLCE